jgi:hypothetical protein
MACMALFEVRTSKDPAASRKQVIDVLKAEIARRVTTANHAERAAVRRRQANATYATIDKRFIAG